MRVEQDGRGAVRRGQLAEHRRVLDAVGHLDQSDAL
jgi:hypothetical protein